MWDNVRVTGANFRRFASEKSFALPDDRRRNNSHTVYL